MEPIQPIHSVEGEHFVYMPAIKPTDPVQTAASVQKEPDIDYARLRSDQGYLRNTLEWIIYKARLAYAHKQYAQADTAYEMFFRYFRFVKSDYVGSLKLYFPALLEYSYSLELHQRATEAEKFLNEELSHRLESIAHTELSSLPIEGGDASRILQLQEAGQLPSPGHLNMRVPHEALYELASHLQSAGEPEVAEELLGHLEVRQMLELLRTRQMSQNLQPPQANPTMAQQAITNFSSSRWGLPVIALWPTLPAEERKKAQSVSYTAPYHVHKVEPVQPPDDDTHHPHEHPLHTRPKHPPTL